MSLSDRRMLMQILAGQVPNLEQAIQPPVELPGRVFCLVIMTKNGFKFGFHSLDG